MKVAEWSMFVGMALLLSPGIAVAQARSYGEQELRRAAVREGGAIAVMSDGHALWSPSCGADKMFDGNLATWYDPKQVADDTWAGFGFTVPQHLTRFRFRGYHYGTSDDNAVSARMRACVIEGANQPDFSDAIVLHSLSESVPANWGTAPYWVEAGANPEYGFSTFRYFRIRQPKNGSANTFAGSLAELEAYGMDDDAYRVFDGDPTTTLALKAGDTVFRDFGTEVEFVEARLLTFDSAALVGSRIEVADTADFASVRTVATVTAVAADEAIVKVALPGVRGRAIRWVAANDCELGEAAFVPDVTPRSVTKGDDAGAYTQQAVISWSRPVGIDGRVTVERAQGAGGPWEEVAAPGAATSSWTDTTAVAGIPYYYRVVANVPVCGDNVSMTSEVFRHRRLEPLERTAANRTELKVGVSIIYKYGGTVWTPSTSTTAEGVTNSVMLAFDNKWPTGTDSAHNGYNYADLKAVTPRTCLGVDFGAAPCYVEKVRLNWGVWSSNKTRVNGAMVAGSNQSNWNEDGQFVNLAGPLQHSGESFHWYELPVTATGPYRYLFVHNPDNNGWGCNVSELEFYGWPVANVATVASGVRDLTVVRNPDGTPTLRWHVDSAYGSLKVERLRQGDEEWTPLAEDLVVDEYVDHSLVPDGVPCRYRVKTVNGDDYAYSAELDYLPYLPGSGTGLSAVWTSGYDSTRVTGDEIVTAVTNRCIELAGADSREHTLVRWTGRLLVPIAGDWAFEAEADDTLALWIDGKAILYRPAHEGQLLSRQEGTISLEAGEHELTAVYFRNVGSGICRLYWKRGSVRELIPTSQLVPEAPRPLPQPWLGARTFSGSAETNFVGDVKVGADGSFDLAFGGADLYFAKNGYGHLYRAYTGDFTCTVCIDSLPATRRNGQKGGLMVRSEPAASSPFEAFFIMSSADTFRLGGKYREFGATDILDSKSIGSDSTWADYVAARTWLRLQRKDGKFRLSAKTEAAPEWRLYFERDASHYGDTVYVGPATSGGTTEAYVPSYYWRFSNFRIHGPQASVYYIR